MASVHPCSVPRGEAPVMMGTIVKKGQRIKSWKERHCVVSRGILQYFESKGRTLPLGAFGLRGASVGTIIDSEKGECVQVTLTSPQRVFIFWAEGDDKRKEWIKFIKAEAETLDKWPVEEEAKQVDSLKCRKCFDEFSFFNRRNKCRECGYLFCTLCCSGETPIPRIGSNEALRTCAQCYIIVTQGSLEQRDPTDFKTTDPIPDHLQTGQKCQVCGERPRAIWCDDCKRAMCMNCTAKVHDRPDNKKHTRRKLSPDELKHAQEEEAVTATLGDTQEEIQEKLRLKKALEEQERLAREKRAAKEREEAAIKEKEEVERRKWADARIFCDSVTALSIGTPIRKIPSSRLSGIKSAIMFLIREGDEFFVSWNSEKNASKPLPRTDKTDCWVPVSNMQLIRGQVTDNFRRRKDVAKDASMSFSIVSNNSIDLICSSQDIYDMWVRVLDVLVVGDKDKDVADLIQRAKTLLDVPARRDTEVDPVALETARQRQLEEDARAATAAREAAEAKARAAEEAEKEAEERRTKMMRACVFTAYGDLKEVLKVTDVPKPEFDPDGEDVMIEVAAASVNPIDWKFAKGFLQKMLPVTPPMGLCKDGSGVIVKMGAKVPSDRGLAVGAEVYFDTFYKTPTLAEIVVTKHIHVALRPSNISLNEAASLPLAALTGYQALVTHGGLEEKKEGQKALILGGAGGVGTFAIQWASHVLGAHVATTASERNKALVENLGAHEVINYREKDWSEELKGQDYDLVFDAAGEKDAYARASGVLKETGTFVSITGNPMDVPQVAQQKKLFFLTESSGVHLDIIRARVEDGSIKPIVERVFPLVLAKQAVQQSAGGKTSGKIVVMVKSAN